MLRWVFSRVVVIYFIIFVFALSCVDLKTFKMRIKVRRLNQAVPNFADMINFSEGKAEKVYWAPYRRFFQLILSYIPSDIIARELLGYVDFYSAQENQAIDLFKSSTTINGQLLLWSNYNLGVLYYKKGMWPQAEGYLLKAISSNSQLDLLMMRNAIVYKQILVNSAFTYDLQDTINEAKGGAYILLLSSLYHEGAYDRMVQVADFGLKNQHLFPRVDFYYYAGLGYYEKGRLHEAFLFFQKSLEFNKDNPDVYFYIADICRSAGRPEQARDFLKVSYLLHQKNDPRFPYERGVSLRFF